MAYHLLFPSVPHTSHCTAAKWVGRGWARSPWRASPAATASMIPANSRHFTRFYRLLPRPRCRPRLRSHPLRTAAHGIRLREGRPVQGHPTARSANGADTNCYADTRPAVVAAAAIAPPAAAGFMKTHARTRRDRILDASCPRAAREKMYTRHTPASVRQPNKSN